MASNRALMISRQPTVSAILMSYSSVKYLIRLSRSFSSRTIGGSSLINPIFPSTGTTPRDISEAPCAESPQYSAHDIQEDSPDTSPVSQRRPRGFAQVDTLHKTKAPFPVLLS